jgi:phospholipid/cholesterol/gamma-HCH transport system substrate-binding protein
METRSNHVLVGGVVLAIVAFAVVFMIWMSQVGNGHQQKYDVFFPSSVDGLAKGSQVTFSGVPVGKIDDIKLLPDSPELVRVRISIDDSTPVLKGTTATIAGVGFTGVSQINLAGATKGQPPITDVGPFGVPVIPTKPGALGQLLNSAPVILNKISLVLDKLNAMVDERNQKSLREILANVDTLTGTLAQTAPQLKDTLAAANKAIGQAGVAADQLAKLSTSANQLMDSQGKPMIADLRATIQSAKTSTEKLNALLDDARPGVQTLSKDTAPQIDQLIRDLSDMAETLTATANKFSSGSGLLGGRRLPTYKPGK